MSGAVLASTQSRRFWRWRTFFIALFLLVVLVVLAVVTFPRWQAYLPPIEATSKAEREVVLDRSIYQVALILNQEDNLRKIVESTGAELIEREVTEGGFDFSQLLALARGEDLDLSIKADMKITSPDAFVVAPFLPMKQEIEVEADRISVITYLERPTSVLHGSRLVMIFTKGEGDQTILNASLELDVSIRHLPPVRGIVEEQTSETARRHLDAEIDCLIKIVDASQKIPFSSLEGIGETFRGFLNFGTPATEVDDSSLQEER